MFGSLKISELWDYVLSPRHMRHFHNYAIIDNHALSVSRDVHQHTAEFSNHSLGRDDHCCKEKGRERKGEIYVSEERGRREQPLREQQKKKQKRIYDNININNNDK